MRTHNTRVHADARSSSPSTVVVVVVVVLVAAAAATIEAATLPSPATVGAPSQPAASSAAARHPQQPPQPQQLGQVIRQQDVESRDGREVPTAACRPPRCVDVRARDSPVSPAGHGTHQPATGPAAGAQPDIDLVDASQRARLRRP